MAAISASVLIRVIIVYFSGCFQHLHDLIMHIVRGALGVHITHRDILLFIPFEKWAGQPLVFSKSFLYDLIFIIYATTGMQAAFHRFWGCDQMNNTSDL